MSDEKPQEKSLSEKTMLSLHLVIIIMGLAIWTIRLSDKVDTHEIAMAEFKVLAATGREERLKLERRIYDLEIALKNKKDK